MPDQPWTNSQLKRLSRCLRDGTDVPDGTPPYGEVMLWYNDVAVDVLERIRAMDWSSLLGSRPIEVGSRAKTIDTLRQKLIRDHATPLPSVQDVAGVRFEAEMSLDEQDAVAEAIAAMFGHGNESIKDLRRTPHSGYRAVHIWLRLPVRVEVQVRTHLQGEWANTFEAAADALGREIRYGHLPAEPNARDVVHALTDLSVETIAAVEQERNGLERALLGIDGYGRRAPLLSDQQAKSRLEDDRQRWLQSEQKIQEQLRRIHDQFRAIQKGT